MILENDLNYFVQYLPKKNVKNFIFMKIYVLTVISY